jgi:hypothetical protein
MGARSRARTSPRRRAARRPQSSSRRRARRAPGRAPQRAPPRAAAPRCRPRPRRSRRGRRRSAPTPTRSRRRPAAASPHLVDELLERGRSRKDPASSWLRRLWPSSNASRAAPRRRTAAPAPDPARRRRDRSRSSAITMSKARYTAGVDRPSSSRSSTHSYRPRTAPGQHVAAPGADRGAAHEREGHVGAEPAASSCRRPWSRPVRHSSLQATRAAAASADPPHAARDRHALVHVQVHAAVVPGRRGEHLRRASRGCGRRAGRWTDPRRPTR